MAKKIIMSAGRIDAEIEKYNDRIRKLKSDKKIISEMEILKNNLTKAFVDKIDDNIFIQNLLVFLEANHCDELKNICEAYISKRSQLI